MSRNLEILAKIFAEVSGIDPSTVEADKHVFTDLGIDSLDFLDIVFDIDNAFSVKLPVEEWLAQVEQDRSLGPQLFTVKNILDYVDSARAAA
jgi:acyl carrier protein